MKLFMNYKDILTTYFSQFLVLVGAIGTLVFYFIKRSYDLSSKKVEIKLNLFFENKLLAVKEYISCYKILEQKYSDTSYHKVVKHVYTVNEMDEMFRPSINNLHSAYSNLFLYFNKNELETFEKLHSSAIAMHATFSKFYFDSSPENYSEETSDLGMKVVSFIHSNERMLLGLGTMVRKEFTQ